MMNSSERRNIESSHERPLREILYLDFNRITSYLSQLHNGLTEYFERVDASNVNKKNPTAEAQIGGGALPIGVKFSRGSTENIDTFTTVQRQILHHAALGAFEDVLAQRSILGEPGSGKPFLKIIGNPFIIDYSKIVKSTKFITESPVIQQTDEEKFQTKVVYSAMEKLGPRVDVYFYDEKIAGALQRDFLLIDSEVIEVAYGIPIRASTTLLALDMTGSPISIRVSEDNSGNLPALALFFQQTDQDNVGKLETFDDEHMKVIPIAIFIDIDSTTT